MAIASTSLNWLDQFEPLEVIGNGSFGIIRKVRRRPDGKILARKELNFERMSDRDRKQIVAEVNILKELDHENIVRYHDRFVDRDQGILYITMEYCGGGDLSTIIKHHSRAGRTIPEDVVWGYFLQILLALQHCHFPSSRNPETFSSPSDAAERQQILHRDLKPENVFLDENNVVKLGDFGLSKALTQASFANTYVGTPYYMSPELMQERAYDIKSDIWSLGCLVYELCALVPPFHEAKTHNELSAFIRNGRIPPLPKVYSHSLNQVIRSMLNLNPSLRPSAQQLLHHERMDLAHKVLECEKMLALVKEHKSTLAARERDLQQRESLLMSREREMTSEMERRVREAVASRETELRKGVLQHEAEVRAAMERREEEIRLAVLARENEVQSLWIQRENELRAEVTAREAACQAREQELLSQYGTLQKARDEFEASVKAGRSGRKPLRDIENIVSDIPKAAGTPERADKDASKTHFPAVKETPGPSSYQPVVFESAMKGVVLTSTGEYVATPAQPSKLSALLQKSPAVGLRFGKIFDFEDNAQSNGTDEDDEDEPPPSPSHRESQRQSAAAHPTRLRRPSIRASPAQRPASASRTESCPATTAQKPERCATTSSTTDRAASTSSAVSVPAAEPPVYDLADEENLPSPFLKRVDRERATRAFSAPAVSKHGSRRTSNGNNLRAIAAANSVAKEKEKEKESKRTSGTAWR